ncbi:MAG: TonB-dependent receptor [Candidatus Desantisbacteria bacterium]
MKQPLIKLFFISSLILYSQPVFSQEPLELLLFNEDELVVTAAKREQKIIEAPCAIKVVTRGEIEAWGYRNLEELLRAQHEVDIANNGVFTIVSLRGCGGTSGSERVLFLLDGRPLNAVILGSVEPRMVGLDNVERIEILQGPGSAMYGANAFGGVINIITRSADKNVFEVTSLMGINKMLDTTKSQAKETFGNSRYCQVCYGNKIEDKMSLFLTASQMDADGAKVNADMKNDVITTKIMVPIKDSSNLTFCTGMSKGELVLAEYIVDDGQKVGRVSIKNQYADVLYNGVLNPVSDLSIRAYSGITNINFQLPTIRIKTIESATITIIQKMEYPCYPESVNGLEVQHNWLINEQNFFICGLDLCREVGELPRYTSSTVTTGIATIIVYDDSISRRHTSNRSALYIQDEFKPDKQLTLTMGARYDQHSIYGSMVSPRLGIVYNLKNHPTVFKASVGKAFRPPDFSELYSQQYFLSVLVQQQPDNPLTPEEITSYEAAIFHQLNEKTMGRIAVFKNKMKNLIDFPFTEFVGSTAIKREYKNQTSSETKGVEVGLEKSLTNNLFASLCYTRLDTPGKDTDIPYIPKSKISLKLDYNPADGLAMGLNGTRVGERRSMAPPAVLPIYFVLNSYLRWNMSDTVSLSVIGQNLLDEEYEEGPYPMTTRRQTVQVRVRYEM